MVLNDEGCITEKSSPFLQWREDVLCEPFCLATLTSLSPQELTQLEASCRQLCKFLGSKLVSPVWAAAACVAGRHSSKMSLPRDVLCDMPLAELKQMLSSIHVARGKTNSADKGPTTIINDVELRAVMSVCARAAQRRDELGQVRVIAGRIRFDEQEIMDVIESPAEEDLDEDQLLPCMSSDIGFWWPNSGPDGTLLGASLGLHHRTNVLEVNSVIKPSAQSVVQLRLKIDVHLVSRLWPDGLVMEGLEVKVDDCTMCITPVLDIADGPTQQALTCSEEVLCILVVRGADPSMQSSIHDNAMPVSGGVQQAISIGEESSFSDLLNALALSPPLPIFSVH